MLLLISGKGSSPLYQHSLMGSSSTSSLGMGRRRCIEPFASYRTEGSSGIHCLWLGTLGIDDQDWSLDGQADLLLTVVELPNEVSLSPSLPFPFLSVH